MTIPKTSTYLKRYLAVAPISLAIWRAVEAKHLGKVKLKRPVLDIGCGFGEFAGVFFDSHVEMGVDIDYGNLIKAIKGEKYTSLSRADARNLPFKNNSFASIISVSTMEHIEGVDRVFKEAFRVLKPNGLLAMTVVTNKVNDYIFFGPALKRIGLGGIGKLYTDTYNRVFKHRTILSKGDWEKFIRQAGFEIEQSKEIISPKVTALFDILLFAAWPSQLFKMVSGKRAVLRPKPLLNLLTGIFLKYVEEEESEGSNLFIVAKKPK